MAIYRALKDVEVDVVGGRVKVKRGELVDFGSHVPPKDFKEVRHVGDPGPQERDMATDR